ncbi:hypothetical protein QP411_09930, partial [Pseudoglutamicibacter cumminsii]
DMMSEELSAALARQIDLAIIHGRQASDGAALSGNPEFINQTTNRVKVAGTPETADSELWQGYDLVVGGSTARDFTGFAM